MSTVVFYLNKARLIYLRFDFYFLLFFQLGDNSVTGVSNNGIDSSATDGSDDALNSSSNEDNDSKAKKKNRCVLCRKKVGLTGRYLVLIIFFCARTSPFYWWSD